MTIHDATTRIPVRTLLPACSVDKEGHLASALARRAAQGQVQLGRFWHGSEHIDARTCGAIELRYNNKHMLVDGTDGWNCCDRLSVGLLD